MTTGEESKPAAGERPLLTLEEMAAELDAEPGWLRAMVRTGRIPALWQDDRLWFRPDIVRPIVAVWTEKALTMDDTHAHEPLPPLRCCDGLAAGQQDEAGQKGNV